MSIWNVSLVCIVVFIVLAKVVLLLNFRVMPLTCILNFTVCATEWNDTSVRFVEERCAITSLSYQMYAFRLASDKFCEENLILLQ